MQWISQCLDRPISADEASGALINAGLPIESITPHGTTSVLDVEVTSNRSDCLSHFGLARELAALTGRTFKLPEVALAEVADSAASAVAVEVRDARCPYYVARVIRGVKIGPSPAWMADYLESVGLRSVNNVVDITNFVMLETGQPLHAFDANNLAGRRIVVRAAAADEAITTIDGRGQKLATGTLVIADEHHPAAVAGVMGGKASEVSADTTTIVLESAQFDPLAVRFAARALGLMTDSSYRFERGLDPAAAEFASRRAAQLMHEIAGGNVLSGAVTVGAPAGKRPPITLRPERVRQVLGVDVPPQQIVEILTKLGFAPEATGGNLTCVAPSWRLDVTREIDLVEEVARAFGYGQIPTHTQICHAVQADDPHELVRRRVRDVFTACGFNEVITFTFVDADEAGAFLPGAPARPIAVSDAVRKVSNVLRPSVFPSLLRVRRLNQNAGTPDARIFEHAAAFWQGDSDGTAAPSERMEVAAVGNSLAELRAVAQLALRRLAPEETLHVTVKDQPYFVPGVSAELRVAGAGGPCAGVLGQFSDSIIKRYDLRQAAFGLALYWPELLAIYQPRRRATTLPKFPPVKRDLSVVVANGVRYLALEQSLTGAHLEHLTHIDFVVTYRDKQIGSDKKSVTLSLAFRDPAGTLKAEQVDVQMARAVAVLQDQHGAILRG